MLINYMMQTFNINFTYASPSEDIEKVVGYNPDSSINIKFTLIGLRQLLQDNVDIINRLLENVDSITNIYSNLDIGSNVSMTLALAPARDATMVVEKLKEDNIIKDISADEENSDSDTASEALYASSSEDETNYDRLRKIKNLSLHNKKEDLEFLSREYDTDYSSTDDSGDDLIRDDANKNDLINKYIELCSSDTIKGTNTYAHGYYTKYYGSNSENYDSSED